jgi:hypothetical protein
LASLFGLFSMLQFTLSRHLRRDLNINCRVDLDYQWREFHGSFLRQRIGHILNEQPCQRDN